MLSSLSRNDSVKPDKFNAKTQRRKDAKILPPPVRERMKGTCARASRFVLPAAGLLAASAVLAVLFFFDPATNGFYPVCPLHQLTGLQCPGCGGLRAMHQLLHGHFAAAWRLNPLVIVLPPAALLAGLEEWARGGALRSLVCRVARPAYGWAAVAALVVFGVLRNLRWPAL
jgi:hypothetical protein